MRFVAVVILVLGLVSVNSGLTLAGSPLAMSNLARSFQQVRSGSIGQAADLDTGSQVASTKLNLSAQNYGYFPRTLFAKAGEPITMDIVTENVASCSRDFVIPALGYETLLPATGIVTVYIPAQPSGTVMPFTCSMGMYTGNIVFGD